MAASRRMLAGKGMDEATFMASLEMFPKVRGPDYVGKENLRRSAPALAPSSQLAIKDTSAVPTDGEFWTSLNEFLRHHYSTEDAMEILHSFETEHFKYMASLNLEEFEGLAEAFATTSAPAAT